MGRKKIRTEDTAAPWDELPDEAVVKRGRSGGGRIEPWDGQSDADAVQTAAEPDPDASEDAPVRPRRQTTLASVLSGNILSRKEVRRAYPYMIFVVIFMFFYITNAFRTQHIYRERAALAEQVRELRSRSMIVASEKMQATRQSNIIIELERRGIPLKESLTPNKVIPRDDGTQ